MVKTVAQLRKSCKRIGVKYSGLKKAQLLRRCASPKKKSPKKKHVQKRCSDEWVAKCHETERRCSQNTYRTACHKPRGLKSPREDTTPMSTLLKQSPAYLKGVSDAVRDFVNSGSDLSRRVKRSLDSGNMWIGNLQGLFDADLTPQKLEKSIEELLLFSAETPSNSVLRKPATMFDDDDISDAVGDFLNSGSVLSSRVNRALESGNMSIKELQALFDMDYATQELEKHIINLLLKSEKQAGVSKPQTVFKDAETPFKPSTLRQKPDFKNPPPFRPSTMFDEDLPPPYSPGLPLGFRRVQRRCSAKKVSRCHRKSRICSQNTSITRCRLSAKKIRARARASRKRASRK